MAKYNKRIWLNNENSHFTGSMVCHDGVVSNQGRPPERYTFMEICDCHRKIRVHKDANLPMDEFVGKLALMRDEINSFINHLNING